MSDIQVPTCFTGTITPLPPISSCMDGATHQLHTITPNPARLKATTGDVQNALDRLSESKTIVSVCGNWVWGPECSHLAVYHVSPLDIGINKQFIVISLTASLPDYRECSVVPQDAIILMIYSKVYGPDSEGACLQWVADNCGKNVIAK